MSFGTPLNMLFLAGLAASSEVSIDSELHGDRYGDSQCLLLAKGLESVGLTLI